MSSLIVECFEKLECGAVINDFMVMTTWDYIKDLIFVQVRKLLVFHNYFVTKTVRFSMLS